MTGTPAFRSFPRRPAGPWRIATRVDHPDPAQANGLALADLAGGADTLRLVSADAPGACGFGLRLDTPADFDTMFEDVALDLIGVSLDAGADGFGLAGRLLGLVERRGLDLATLDLDLGIDPVSVLATAGAWPLDWPATAGQLAELARTLAARGGQGTLVRADGRPWHGAGGSEAQELAAVLSSGVLALRAFEQHGIALADGCGRLSFMLTADTGLVPTVAKFRALRCLWARVEQACGLAPTPIRLEAETAWRQMSAIAPHTNLIRGAIACFGAAVGGADRIGVLPFTLPIGLPDAAARRLARNTQHVLAEESHLWRVADPAAGAETFETATLALCEEAWALFQQIEREGGIVQSLVDGRMQARVAASRDERHSRLADGRDGLVGLTLFRAAAEAPPVVLIPARPVPVVAPTGPLVAQPLPRRRDAEPFEHPGDTA